MSDPKVSVVMSVYNGLPYLHAAVEGILAQTFPDFEFIIINDGSTDATPSVLEHFAEVDARIRILENPKNIGYTNSLNRGISIARGELIARQDADDFSLPTRLARQVEFLDRHPQVGLVGTLPEFIDERGHTLPVGNYKLLTDNATMQEAILDQNCIHHGSVMFRRALLEIVGVYKPELEPAEDYDLWLRLAEVSQIANLDQPLYRYRQYTESVSGKRRYTQMLHKAQSLESAFERRYGSHTPPGKKFLLARDYLRAAILAFIKQEDDLARHSLERSLDLYPTIIKQQAEPYLIQYAPDSSNEKTMQFVTDVFARLFPKSLEMSMLKDRIISDLNIQQAFLDVQSGNDERVGRHLWAGVTRRPRWLLNWGVLSLILKRSLHI
jgi:glycosyltransferase involved in cell wall biosynthesis